MPSRRIGAGVLAPRWTRAFPSPWRSPCTIPFLPLRAFDGGSWLFRQMVQAQLFIPPVRGWSSPNSACCWRSGSAYLCWQEGGRWYAVGAGLALLGSLLLVVVRHTYDWWLFKLGRVAGCTFRSTEARNIPLPYRAPFMAARRSPPAGWPTLGQSFPTALESRT